MPMLPKNGEYWRLVQKSKKANKRARKCLVSNDNKNGWCNRHQDWCSNCNKDCVPEGA